MPGNPAYGIREKVLVLMLTHREMTATRLVPHIWPRGDLRTLTASAGGLLGRMKSAGFLKKLSDRPPVFGLTAKGEARAKAAQKKVVAL